jgi:hypothetical protein
MITLNELSVSELQYLRSKWSSEKTELNKERARKMDRLEERLSSQDDDATAQAEKVASLNHAQAVLDQLVSSAAAPPLIAAQQAVIDELQAQVDGFGLSSSFVSNTDALMAQMEFDELEFAVQKRTDRLAEVDALLA